MFSTESETSRREQTVAREDERSARWEWGTKTETGVGYFGREGNGKKKIWLLLVLVKQVVTRAAECCFYSPSR